MTDGDTAHTLHEAIRMRDQLLDEASRLLAAGSGDTSPEYQEFVRLRKELPHTSRTPDLSHALQMVRKKTKELRGWLRRADRALGTTDPVDGILAFMRKRLTWTTQSDQPEAADCLIALIGDIGEGKWIDDLEDNEDEEVADQGAPTRLKDGDDGSC